MTQDEGPKAIVDRGWWTWISDALVLVLVLPVF